jgi:hypothetical protein
MEPGLLGLASFAESIGKAFSAVAEVAASSRKARVRIDTRDCRQCLLDHIERTANWADRITFQLLARDKRLEEAFIGLDLTLGRTTHRAREAPRSFSVDELFASRGHTLILGRPGAGKTTTLKRIASLALQGRELGTPIVPIVVRLREIRPDQSLFGFLASELGISVTADSSVRRALVARWEGRAVRAYLDKIGALLLADGWDELNPACRDACFGELTEIVTSPGTQRVVVSSRPLDFDRSIEGLQAATIEPLSDEQVRRFAVRWLGAEHAQPFVEALRKTPYAGVEVLPLSLAHLSAIYERDGALPSRPVDVYEQVVALLVEEWDKQRGVRRKTKFDALSWRKRERFLGALAYELTLSDRRGSFESAELEAAFNRAAPAFGLESADSLEVIQELEAHTGIFVQSGFRRFDWIHLSIQEFLCATHARGIPGILRSFVPRFPNELAVVVSLSTDPVGSLADVWKSTSTLPRGANSARFVNSFFSRLAQERPAWQASPSLGWCCLAFLDLAYQGTPERNAWNEQLSEYAFVQDPVLVASLRMALASAMRYPRSGFVEVFPRDPRGGVLETGLGDRPTEWGGLRVPHRIMRTLLQATAKDS